MPGEEWPCIRTRSPAVRPARRMPEVLVADVIQGRRGLEARDVPTQLGAHLVRPQHGGYGIPPDQRADRAFQRKVSRVPRLPAGHNGVQVRGIRRVRHRHADAASLREQFRDQESWPLGALELRDRAERIDPLAGLAGIQIQLLGHGSPSALRATSTSGEARRASPATLREGAPPDSAGYTAVAEPAGTGRSGVAATPGRPGAGSNLAATSSPARACPEGRSRCRVTSASHAEFRHVNRSRNCLWRLNLLDWHGEPEQRPHQAERVYAELRADILTGRQPAPRPAQPPGSGYGLRAAALP